MQILASCIVSTSIWASFPERCLIILAWFLSERAVVIRETRSSMGRASLVNLSKVPEFG